MTDRIKANGGASEYSGCDGLYNDKGHQVLAGDIVQAVRRILAWGPAPQLATGG